MESRKLISFGSSSYVISIPKSWIESNALKKGDSIYIEERPNELVLYTNSTDQTRKPRELQIDGSGKSIERLRVEIVSGYLRNFDLIEVRNLKEDAIVKVKEILQNLAGMEIMEQTKAKLIAKDLINMNELSIKVLMRRMDIILRSMLDDTALSPTQENVNDIYQRDADLNRLYYLTKRIMFAALEEPKIAKALETTPLEIFTDLEVAVRLEKIGDQCKRIARFLRQAKSNRYNHKEIVDLLTELKSRYLEAMKAYYSRDRESAFDIEVNADQLIDRCNKLNKNRCEHLIAMSEHLKAMATSIRFIARAVAMYAD